MKYVTLIAFIGSLASIVYGFTLPEAESGLADTFIGGGTAGLFLLAMPLFLYTYSKGKNIKDYMLTEENILEMRKRENEMGKKK